MGFYLNCVGIIVKDVPGTVQFVRSLSRKASLVPPV